MKKQITKRAGYFWLKLTTLMFAFLLVCVQGWGQTTIFTESMGTVAATTTIAAHEAANGFDNDAYTMTSGGATNPGDLRATSVSSGYTGASGQANVWLTSTNAAYGFAIEGIDASAYNSLTVQFGYRKELAASLPTLALDYWDGTTYVNVPFTFSQAANAAVAWYLSPVITLPSGAQINTLKLRWVKTGAVAVRLDDIVLKGTPGAVSAPTTQAYNINFGSVGQNQMNAGWTNGDGAKRIVIINTSNSFTDPTDGTDPTPNTVYSGSGEQVVYNNSSNSVTVTGLSAGTTYWFRVYEYNGSGALTKYLTTTATNNPNSQITSPPAPLITVSTNTLTGFTYVVGNGPSTPPKTFTISGSNLSADISISAPTNYEISDGSGFGTSLTLTQSGGTVGNTTISVQLKAGLAIGNYNSEDITASSSGASNQTVTCSGTVTQDCTPVFPFYENFPSAAGTLLVNNCWSAHSGAGTNPVTVAAGTITYPGYLSSGTGNEVSLTTTGEDVNRTFIQQTSGSVYVGFLVNVSASSAVGDYFLHIGPTPASGNIFQGRVYIKKDASTSNFAFGLNKGSTAGTLAYSGFNYSPGTTYLVVLKYTFNNSSTTDDAVSLYVDPSLNTMEPAPLLTVVDALTTDLTKADFIALRQGSALNAPTLELDGIRISRSWSNIVGIPPAPLAYDVTGGGSYCQNGSGLPVGLSNSETGVTYELWKDSNPTGAGILGNTGSPLSWGNQGAGTYTIKGANDGGTTTMTGEAVIIENSLVTPTFTQLGPYIQGGTPDPLPNPSNNGISGTWSPGTISTTTAGVYVHTFTPDAGVCATTKTMTIVINSPVPEFTFSQDIGTTLYVAWPAIPGAVYYSVQRATSPGGPWVGLGSNINMAKIVGLTQSIPYYWRAFGYTASGGQIGPVNAPDPYTTATVTYPKTFDIGTTCQIGWNDCDPWSNYYVFYYKKPLDANWIGVASNINYRKLTGLTPETTYDCKVTVYKNNSIWGTTEQGSFTTGKMDYAASNITTNSMQITWSANETDVTTWASSSVLYYRVFNGPPAWAAKAVLSNANTVNITGLTPNTTYECRVIPYKSSYIWGTAQISSLQFTTLLSKEFSTESPSQGGATVYPNPFVDQVSMDLFTEEPTKVTWNLYDMTGKLVLSGSESMPTGYSTLNIDAAGLSKGIYMLNAIMNDQAQNFRIMKQ